MWSLIMNKSRSNKHVERISLTINGNLISWYRLYEENKFSYIAQPYIWDIFIFLATEKSLNNCKW